MWQDLCRLVFHYLLGLGISKADAEDLAQETLLSTYLHLDGIQDGKLKSYVLLTAKINTSTLAGPLLLGFKRPTRHDSHYFLKMLHKMLKVSYNSRIRGAFHKDKILYNHPGL